MLTVTFLVNKIWKIFGKINVLELQQVITSEYQALFPPLTEMEEGIAHKIIAGKTCTL